MVLGVVNVLLFGLGVKAVLVGAIEVVPSVWFDPAVVVIVLLSGLNVVELAEGGTVVVLFEVFGVVKGLVTTVVRFPEV